MDHWTVAMLGDSGVGKNRLANEFMWNSIDYFPGPVLKPHRGSKPTISQDDYSKQIIVDNRMSMVSVVHNADLDECAAHREQLLREGQGFIIIYSVSDRTSFDRVNHWREIIKGDPAALLLVGNKCDQNDAREVSRSEGEARAKQLGCSFLETSTKTVQNVERLFVTIVRLLRDAARRRVAAAASEQDHGRKRTKCSVL
ncbi:ras protein [Roridomyces roridus]|uniref:Ras protein n=1 Tax=Roridomyces roridus TaxID=1738132 RepID=A0AAD7FMW8_9AGAR|nr:ras protein [Roridomyces roridus]